MFNFICVLDRKLHPCRRRLLSEVKVAMNSKHHNIEAIVSCIINNTVDAIKLDRDKFYITLNRNDYSYTVTNGSRVNIQFSYNAFIAVLSAMESLGYLRIEKGGRVYKYDHKTKMATGNGLVVDNVTYSYAIITDKFIEILPYDIDNSFRKMDNVITLRDFNKKDIEFSMPKCIKVKKVSVDNYNDIIRHADVKDAKGNRYDCQVRKIFNNCSFRIGGRSYMSTEGIQSLSKDERMTLTITGRNTVIYDFVAFEASIAYTLAGVEVQGDPYMKVLLDGYPRDLNREINKLMLTVLFNSDYEDDVASVVGYHLSKKFDIAKLYEDGIIPEPVIPLRSLLVKFEDAYADIHKFFYCGSSNEISRIGSEIMDYIIDFFMQRGDVVLPVFDEVICPDTLENELLMAMKLGWKSVLNSDINFNVRKEK